MSMRNDDIMGRVIPGAFVLALVAGGAGFGLAKLTSKGAPPPAEAKAEAPADTVKVKDSDLQVMRIGVEAASGGDLAAEVLAPATVTAQPQGEAMVTAHAAGSVIRIDKRLGEPVRAGEVLAQVQSREAAQLAADHSAAEARAVQARQAAAREQSLFDQRVSPRQDLEAAKANLAAAEAQARSAGQAAAAAHIGKDGASVMVTSPIAGRITAASVQMGAFVQPEAELFRVADPSRVQIEASVTAAEAARLKPGDAARASLGSGEMLKAKVRSVTPALDPATRSATVVLELETGAPALTPGSALQVVITPRQASASGAIVLPEDAIQNLDGRDVVFARTADGFRVQPVRIAARSGGRASVVSGLKPGDQIATHNAFLLKAEMGKGQDDE